MKAKIIIPARYQSRRFPGKPLADILGKSLIQRVWLQCCQALPASDVFVATDDISIKEHCQKNGIGVLMTSSDCLTGTDRVYEASKELDADFIVNVQGDEPLVSPDDITKVIEAHSRRPDFIHCGMCRIKSEKDFRSASVPKVVCKDNGRLLYMSRAGIPTDKQLSFSTAMRQVCIYAFGKEALRDFAEYGRKARIEAVEDIEILRFMEMDYDVEMVELSDLSVAVDFPEDVDRVVTIIKANENLSSKNRPTSQGSS